MSEHPRRHMAIREAAAVVALMTASLLLPVPDASADDAPLRQELSRIAVGISDLLKADGRDSIAIGQFAGPPNFPSSAGAGIVQILTEEFEKQGIAVKTRAAVGLKGSFELTEVESAAGTDLPPGKTLLALRVEGELVDSFGKVLTTFNLDGQIEQGRFQADIQDEQTIAETVGVSVVLPADELPEDRDQRLREGIVEPGGHIVGGTQAFANSGSPYGIEILVGGQPRAVTLDEALLTTDLQLGEEYHIRVINKSEHDAAVRLKIDGMSVFHFSELRHLDGKKKDQPLYEHYIIPAGGNGVIKGWHKNNQKINAFQIASYEESAAGKLNLESEIGMITASFQAAWDPKADPPADEPPTKKGVPKGNATGIGPERNQRVEEVQRELGVLRATVTVRYAK